MAVLGMEGGGDIASAYKMRFGLHQLVADVHQRGGIVGLVARFSDAKQREFQRLLALAQSAQQTAGLKARKPRAWWLVVIGQ